LKKRILGITGGVGAGKSMILAYLQEHYGACVISCDQVAADLQKPEGACYGPMLQLLGEEVLRPDKTFDRAAIAARVFADEELLSRINGIVHPLVYREVREMIRQAGDRLVVIESALLLETGYRDICDEIWYVFALEEIRKQRLKKDRGYSDERIRSVMQSQKDERYFRSGCDYVIDNSLDPDFAYRQIDRGLSEHGFMYDRQREQR